MRVGLIAPPWVPVPPPRYGGTEAVVDRLARGLVAAGHEVILFATGDSTCPVPTRWAFPRAQGLRLGSDPIERQHILSAYAVLARADVDVIHDHTMLGPLYACGLPGPPIVTTCHGPLTETAASFYESIADRVAVVAISAAQRRSAPRVSVAAVIHHGIESDRFPIGAGDGGYVLFLGRMAPEKGPHRAIAAARRAGVPIVLAAKMWEPCERRFFEEQVEPLLGEDATYVGEVGTEAKLELLGGAVALVNPILWPEPFGLVMIEALACGTPVVTFPQGAAPEIVDHGITGYLCDDEADMAAAVQRIASGALDRAACRSAVETRFSVDGMVGKYVDLYERLVFEVRGATVTSVRKRPPLSPEPRTGFAAR